MGAPALVDAPALPVDEGLDRVLLPCGDPEAIFDAPAVTVTVT